MKYRYLAGIAALLILLAVFRACSAGSAGIAEPADTTEVSEMADAADGSGPVDGSEVSDMAEAADSSESAVGSEVSDMADAAEDSDPEEEAGPEEMSSAGEEAFPGEAETPESEGTENKEASGIPETAEISEIAENIPVEIKLLLDPDIVLDEKHFFTEEFIDLFEIEDEYQPIEVIYLETKDRTFGRESWINRIRLKSGKKKVECTYKKRYPITDNDIAAAASCAALDGLTSGNEMYSAEIDWGYSEMKLSFTWEMSAKYKDYSSLNQFSREDAADLFQTGMPDEEKDWKEAGWGTETLKQADAAGPISFLRAKGTWDGIEIKAEIWPLPESSGSAAPDDSLQQDGTNEAAKLQDSSYDEESIGYMCELSASAENYTSAEEIRAGLMKCLDENGMLLHEDLLKTQAILDAYLQ